MAGDVQETREQEVARVRSYIASQSLRRTNAQLVEALQQAHQQFMLAANSIPESLILLAPGNNQWSTLDVIHHMRTMGALDLAAVSSVLKDAKKPAMAIRDVLEAAPVEVTRSELLTELQRLRDELGVLVLNAAPTESLDITWSHPEFGAMHWREWVLFARVHTLDHLRQIQSIGEALIPRASQEGKASQ